MEVEVRCKVPKGSGEDTIISIQGEPGDVESLVCLLQIKTSVLKVNKRPDDPFKHKQFRRIDKNGRWID